jgi:hypothetical protein
VVALTTAEQAELDRLKKLVVRSSRLGGHQVEFDAALLKRRISELEQKGSGAPATRLARYSKGV